MSYALLSICTGDTQSYTTLAEKGPTRACCPEPAGVTLDEELLAFFLRRAAREGCHRTEGAKRLRGLKEVACRASGRVLAARSGWRVTSIEAFASANE